MIKLILILISLLKMEPTILISIFIMKMEPAVAVAAVPEITGIKLLLTQFTLMKVKALKA